MAATTAIAFVLLGAAIAAAAGPESFPLRLICGDSTSARRNPGVFPPDRGRSCSYRVSCPIWYRPQP
ncbi:MAG: hypothetical protein MZV63_33495 [Marinilabiliales bacterium]|nr:hypothetical protein [Marinilabiliales bacterium]